MGLYSKSDRAGYSLEVVGSTLVAILILIFFNGRHFAGPAGNAGPLPTDSRKCNTDPVQSRGNAHKPDLPEYLQNLSG